MLPGIRCGGGGLWLRRAGTDGLWRGPPAAGVAGRLVAGGDADRDGGAGGGPARRGPGQGPAARGAVADRRDLYLRRLESGHAAAPRESALADVRAAAELDGRHRSILRRPVPGAPQAGAAGEPAKILGRGGSVVGV